MNGRTDPARPQSKFELLLGFFQARFLSIVGVALLLGGIAAILGLDLDIPSHARRAGLAALVVAPAGFFTGKYILSIFPGASAVFLLDIDAREIDGALFRFPYDDFVDLEVTNGDLCQLTPRLYVGKEVSLEEMTAKGTWRGTLDDVELLRALHKIDECRGTLEDYAKRGFTIETQAFTIVRQAVRRATKTVVQTFEEGTLPDDGDSIGDEVDAALEQYDLESELDAVDPDSDPDRPRDRADLEDDLGDDLSDEDLTEPQTMNGAD